MTTQEIKDAVGIVTFKHAGTVKKSGDAKFDLVRDSAAVWDPDGTGDPNKPNSYVAIPIGDDEEFRHTLRRNMYAKGMEGVESFDVEYRITNVKRSARVPSAASGGGNGGNGGGMSYRDKRDLFVETGDVKSLTAMFVAADIPLADAKRNAKALIDAAK